MTDQTPANPFDVMLGPYRRWAEPISSEISSVVLDRAQLEPRSDVLDVGAGTGALAVQAALLGHHVLAIDIAPASLAIAAERLAGFPGCRAEVRDARDMELEHAGFDASFSVFACTVLGEGVAPAMRNIVNATRPGGTVGVVHWADPMSGPLLTLLSRAVDRLDDPHVGPVRPWDPRYRTAAELEGVLIEAGCVDVTSEEVTIAAYPMPDPEDMLDEMHPMYSRHPDWPHLDEDGDARLRQALADVRRELDTTPGDIPPARARLGLGHIPGRRGPTD